MRGCLFCAYGIEKPFVAFVIVIIRAAGGIAVFLIVPPADSIPVAICGMEQIRENIAGIVIGSNRPVLVPAAIGIPVWLVVQLDCFFFHCIRSN